MQRITVFAALVVLALAACAPRTMRPRTDPNLTAAEAERQRELVVKDQFDKTRRLERVSLPLLTHNAPLCGEKVAYHTGMGYASRPGLDVTVKEKEWRGAYASVLGLDERIKVTNVIENSPAWKAGVREGDVILALQGLPVGNATEGYQSFRKDFTERVKKGETLSLTLERGDGQIEVQVRPEKHCGYPVILIPGSVVNAFADGNRVAVTHGMVTFCQKDEELALIVGHELGHNVMEHIKAKRGNRMIGSIFDIIIGSLIGVNPQIFSMIGEMAYSQEFEAEADYVGLYFVARAGYQIDDAPDIWRRMALAHPESIGKGTTHPSSSTRWVLLEATRDEILKKRAEGRELLPEMQKKKADAAETKKPVEGAGDSVSSLAR